MNKKNDVRWAVLLYLNYPLTLFLKFGGIKTERGEPIDISRLPPNYTRRVCFTACPLSIPMAILFFLYRYPYLRIVIFILHAFGIFLRILVHLHTIPCREFVVLQSRKPFRKNLDIHILK